MYHMILGKKSHQHRCSCVRVCVHMCCVHVCVGGGGGGRSATSRIALYVNLNEAVACTCQNHLRFHLYHFYIVLAMYASLSSI